MIAQMPSQSHSSVSCRVARARLDRTISRTYRTVVDLDDVVPNRNQPRLGPKRMMNCNDRSKRMKGSLNRFWSSRIPIYQENTYH